MQELDMTFDIQWADVEEQRSGQIPPEIGEQEFEITNVTQGIQKQGENVDQKYVNLLCKQMSGEFPGTRSTFKFLGFGTKMGKRGTSQAGETKAFLADIGRSDLFHMPTFDARNLIGTVFIANVAHSTNSKTNQTVVWLNNPKPSLPYAEEQVAVTTVAPAATPMLVPALTQVQMQVAPAPAPVVEPKPAIPRRVRPTPQG